MISPDYIDREGVAHWHENSIPESSKELMQYTGLHDKQGNEIYEGDIVQVYDYGWENQEKEEGDFGLYRKLRIDIVTMERFPIFWLKNESFGYEGEDLITAEECEIIGNIYENPELLKEQNEN